MSRTTVALAFALAFVPQVAAAQAQTANDVLSFLLTTQALPTGDFVKDQQAAEATRQTLANALLAELSNVPLTTSSGGFNYRFNPQLGTLERMTRGFGPFFVDRAATAGEGQASMSATLRYSQFTTLDGRNLHNGSLVTSSNKFTDESAPFDVETLTLDIKTTTFTVFANYGVTDAVDVGIAVPFVHLNLSGERVNTYRGTTQLQARGQADFFGVADIPLRSKFRVARVAGWDLGGNVELRVPTGSRDMLNGSGHYAFSTAFIGSSAGEGRVESHVNAGFTMGGASNQASFAGAVAAALNDRVTVSGETLVRWIDRLSGIRQVAEPHPLFQGVNTIRLLPTGGSTTTVAAVGGLRWNIARSWLLNSYVFVPITRSGLVARPIPTIALDYSFSVNY